MATKKNTAVGQTAPTPASAPATGSITLPEMPPAGSFVGLVAYVVDTATDESQYLPLEFLGRGVQACIDATQASTEQTDLAKTATSNADTATTGANDAAETARGEAENLSALKEAVANAAINAIEKTEAAETATGAANTATTNANNATADAIEKTEAAQTATNEAIAAKDAAIEATENLTSDVSALVLTDANKPRIQELAGIDYSTIFVEMVKEGEFWVVNDNTKRKVYTQTFKFVTPNPVVGFSYIEKELISSGINRAHPVHAIIYGWNGVTASCNVSSYTTPQGALRIRIYPFGDGLTNINDCMFVITLEYVK